MNPEQFLNILACLVVLAFGLYAAIQPRASAKLAGLSMDGAKGRAEIRIAFGAFSIALGAAPLILNQQAAYQTSGIVFLAALAMRLLSLLLDHPPLDRGFIVSGVFELVAGLILFLS